MSESPEPSSNLAEANPQTQENDAGVNRFTPKNSDVADTIRSIMRLPPEVQTIISSISHVGPMAQDDSLKTAISKVVTPQHVSQFLEIQKDEVSNSYRSSRDSKILLVVILLIILIFVLVLVRLLLNQAGAVTQILTGLASFLGGGGFGYVFGHSKGYKDAKSE